MTPAILVICGPTASGKSDLALRLAHALDGEIVNADSMQVYCGMDIGTAKPTPEQQHGIPHHLIDIVRPDQPFSAADFAEVADAAIRDISSRGKRAIVVGGTGLYIRAFLEGLIEDGAPADVFASASTAATIRILAANIDSSIPDARRTALMYTFNRAGLVDRSPLREN